MNKSKPMKTYNFNLSKRPLLKTDNVAYLVDCNNVELYRQYIEKYYNQKELQWFDELILTRIRKQKYEKFILYFSLTEFTYGYYSTNTQAYIEPFTLYYVTNAVMIIE